LPGKPLQLETLKVLVVEDNPVNRLVIKGLLGNLGIKPDLVENGRLAVNLVKASEQAYDLILMDCEMPEVDGYEATRQIRKFEKDSATARALIVAVTAHAVKAFRDRAFECGMDAYLSKPIDTLTLEKMLRIHFCQTRLPQL
jgi:CheY-like chemotaxis protein